MAYARTHKDTIVFWQVKTLNVIDKRNERPSTKETVSALKIFDYIGRKHDRLQARNIDPTIARLLFTTRTWSIFADKLKNSLQIFASQRALTHKSCLCKLLFIFPCLYALRSVSWMIIWVTKLRISRRKEMVSDFRVAKWSNPICRAQQVIAIFLASIIILFSGDWTET